MIDSINFILNNVFYLDIKRLISLGIVYYPLRYQKYPNGKTYVIYGNVKESVDTDEFSVNGIGFSYMDMYFRYLPQFDCIVITTHTQKVLGKTDILLSDRDTYINKIDNIVELLFGAEFSQLGLHRIDYCVDIEMDYKVMYEYIHQLYKHKAEYQHIKRINNYETSIYITSLYGQKSINIYDKYQCEKDKYNKQYQKAYMKSGISFDEYRIITPPDYEKYKNIFRIEVQNTKKLIKQQSKTLIKKENVNLIEQHKINKSLYGYWNQESMQEYFFDFLKEFLYKGTYYKLKKAKQIIKKSGISEYMKAELKEFITVVNKYGISNVIESKAKNNIPKWHKATISKYEDDLQELNIHLINLDQKSKKHLKKEKEKILQSNHSKDWKNKLIEFIIAVGRYGITNISTEDNKEVTIYGKITNHKTWCKETVEKYIAELEKLGINPITLDNDCEFESLESLYTLAEKVTNEKYFDIDKLEIPEPIIKTDTLPPTETPRQNSNETFGGRRIIILGEF